MNEGYNAPSEQSNNADLIATDKEPKVLPDEISMQAEVAETIEEFKDSASKYGFFIADFLEKGEVPDSAQIAELLLSQKNELPHLVSAVLERTCNLQCDHCLYQAEESSKHISKENDLYGVIENIVSQLPEKPSEIQGGETEVPTFMSGGRILTPSHLELFAKLREMRPDVDLKVIDNGTYLNRLSKWPEGFKFDGIDISIDGTESSNNEQRQSDQSYKQAMEGLARAREVAHRVTSLFTLTNINAGDVEETAKDLLEAPEGELALIDKLYMTTMSPTNDINASLEISGEEFAGAWEQIKKVSAMYGPDKCSLSFYRAQDIEKLAAAVGEAKFIKLFEETEEGLGKDFALNTTRNFLNFTIDGVKISYQPLSIWTPEEFLIEADGAYRTAYEGQFTIDELRSGVSKDGRDTTPFTIEQLTPESDFRESYERGVDDYWVNFGKERLTEEMQVFKRIKEKAQQ